jgi:hypothetical protein
MRCSVSSGIPWLQRTQNYTTVIASAGPHKHGTRNGTLDSPDHRRDDHGLSS